MNRVAEGTSMSVSTEHIEIDDRGRPRIIGSRSRVAQVVMDRMANGWDADEIHRQYPHLSLAQIHAAFAYYYDHKEEIDVEIRQSLIDAEELRKQFPEPELVTRLRQRKSHP